MIRLGFLAFAIVAASVQGVRAEAPLWIVDRAASTVEFEATHVGKAFTGRFEVFSATIRFDADDLAGSSIRAEIDTASARTGDRQRDSALPSKDWFSAREHPAAVFEADEIVATDDGRYEARGALTLRGVKQPVVLSFALDVDGGEAMAVGQTTLLRTAFGVGQGEDFSDGRWVGVEVKVRIRISAKRP